MVQRELSERARWNCLLEREFLMNQGIYPAKPSVIQNRSIWSNIHFQLHEVLFYNTEHFASS